ncbi:MAG: hypothetical protein ACRCWQ_02170 [Bacilli bacterium]
MSALLLTLALTAGIATNDYLQVEQNKINISTTTESCDYVVFIDNVKYEADPSYDGKVCVQVVDYAPFVNSVKSEIMGQTEILVNDVIMTRTTENVFVKK